jgi:CheY-like chemotaxis protein
MNDKDVPATDNPADLKRFTALLQSAAADVADGRSIPVDQLVRGLKRWRRSTRGAAAVFIDEAAGVLTGVEHTAHAPLMQQMLTCCADVLIHETDPVRIWWPLNDLRCIQSKKLLSELVFSLPRRQSAAIADELVSVIPLGGNRFSGESFEDAFDHLLREVLASHGDAEPFKQLGSLCRHSIAADTHEYAAIFWLTCACYIESLNPQSLHASPAHRHVLRQIELVIAQHVRDADTPVLDPDGIVLVETTLCHMLSFLACVTPDDPLYDQLESRYRMQHSFEVLKERGPAPAADSLLGAGIAELLRKIARLKLDFDAAPESPQQQQTALVTALAEVKDVSALLIDHELADELTQAANGVENYRRGAGAISDLEHCVAVLMAIEQVVGGQWLSADAAEAGLAPPAEGELDKLDSCIVAEMIAMLEPLNADRGDRALDREWLVVVLGDITSLSTFHTDDFLVRQLARVKPQLSAADTDAESLKHLIVAVREYLLAQRAGAGGDATRLNQSKEGIHARIGELMQKQKRSRPEPPVNIEALANDNRDLLQNDQQVVDGEPAPNNDDVDPVAPLSRLEFGERCNGYIDTIQLALDTALGSSGNLAPDKTVTGALEKLQQLIQSTEHKTLLALIEPLAHVLHTAEQAGSSLSQSDTLLIQEAIVAITIGVDAVANVQPAPALVADVAQRITELAVDGSHQARSGFEAAGLIDVFVEEGEDLAQRLFELFQRWKSAPQGATRLQGDIKRLLHTLKGSADTVGLSHIAQLAHGLESYIARCDIEQSFDANFFTVSTEAIEVILDDIDRLRQREPFADRSEITELLGSSHSHVGVRAEIEDAESNRREFDAISRAGTTKIESIDRTPAFGSRKYFERLETTQRRLSSQFWKAHELQSALRARLSEMQGSLQSAVYLVGKGEAHADQSHLSRSVGESLNDLKQLQSQLQRTLEQLEVVEEQQRSEVLELQSMVATTDLISVEHLEMRSETLIQHLSEQHQKAVLLEFSGAGLELDRKQFSDVFKPIEQLVTNAVVHGIEDGARRRSRGKNEAATIRIAFTAGDKHIEIAVSDDGAGVDFKGLRTQAKTRADYDPACTDAMLLQRIVEQGISTSQKIDRSAGRGVGLDIVREWVFRLHGELSVRTVRDVGTTFTLRIPRAHESIPVMVVQHGAAYLGIDVDKIVEIKARADNGVSLDALTASGAESARATLCCRTSRGTFDLNVDSIVGRKTVKFFRDEQFISSQGDYLGCGVIDNNQVVLRVNLDCLLANHQGNAVLTPQVDVPVETNPASVLIVDDSVTIRAAFGRAMQSAGYRIVLARNGLEAMEYLEAHQPEVIILDLEMPLMDGYELGSYIRNEPRLSRSALVIVSSKPRSVVGDWLTAVNADAYYEKPCSESTIAGVVADLV